MRKDNQTVTISGILLEIGAQADRIEQEKYVRRTNDKVLQNKIDKFQATIKELSNNK